jgi:hypothetical protein
MVLAEAMAAGKPVVALDASGVREVVEDGRNGRLLPGDASRKEFAQAIHEFAGDRQKGSEWEREALKTAQQLSRQTCAQRLLNLYKSVLAEASTYETRDASEDLFPWETLLGRLRAEWELLSEKTKAAVRVMRAEQES